MIRARRMTQLAQGFRFDLSNSLSGNIKLLAHFFQVCDRCSCRYRNAFSALWLPLRSIQTRYSGSLLSSLLQWQSPWATLRRHLHRDYSQNLKKSPKCESSSSPIGVSIEIGSLAIFRTRGLFPPASPFARQLFRRGFTAHFLQHLTGDS